MTLNVSAFPVINLTARYCCGVITNIPTCLVLINAPHTALMLITGNFREAQANYRKSVSKMRVWDTNAPSRHLIA